MKSEKRRILFIVDELPFPPRNGVTLTSIHYLRGLAEHYSVGLAWLRAYYNKMTPEAVAENKKLVDFFWTLDVEYPGRMGAFGGECLLGRPSVAALRSSLAEENKGRLEDYDPDVLLATPLRSFANVPLVERYLPARGDRLKIAAINDSYTATLRERRHQVWGSDWPLGHRARSAGRWLRGLRMAGMEARLLAKADVILVQTRADRAWVERISRGKLNEKIRVLTNAADEGLFETEPVSFRRAFGHVGPLGVPSNRRNVRGLLEQVLPRVRAKHPDAVLTVLGKPDGGGLAERLRRESGVEYIERVPSMEDYYRLAPVVLVRNYKHIGSITRTIEAMALGAVVLGEPGAFNGIEGFVDGEHGYIVRDEAETADRLIRLFGEPDAWRKMSENARRLMRRDFRWADRVEALREIIGT